MQQPRRATPRHARLRNLIDTEGKEMAYGHPMPARRAQDDAQYQPPLSDRAPPYRRGRLDLLDSAPRVEQPAGYLPALPPGAATEGLIAASTNGKRTG